MARTSTLRRYVLRTMLLEHVTTVRIALRTHEARGKLYFVIFHKVFLMLSLVQDGE